MNELILEWNPQIKCMFYVMEFNHNLIVMSSHTVVLVQWYCQGQCYLFLFCVNFLMKNLSCAAILWSNDTIVICLEHIDVQSQNDQAVIEVHWDTGGALRATSGLYRWRKGDANLYQGVPQHMTQWTTMIVIVISWVAYKQAASSFCWYRFT